MYDQITTTCTRMAQDHTLRAVVFTGAGDKAFAAGTDISAFADVTTTDEALAVEARSAAAIRAVQSLPQVTIAAVNGVAAGGGFGLALACDLKLAADHATLGFPIAATLGNALSEEFTQLVVDSVGLNLTRRMLLSAEMITAAELTHHGLWSWVGPAHGLEVQAAALASRVSQLSPVTQVASQDILAAVRDTPHERLSTLPIAEVLRRVYGSEQFNKAVRRFVTGDRSQQFPQQLPQDLLQ